VVKSPGAFVAALREDSAPDRWRTLLAQARQELEQDWPAVYRQAFLETTDKRIWTLIIKEMVTDAPAFQALVQETTTYYRKYPAQFLYLQRNAGKYGIKPEYKGLLSRLLDLLDSDQHKSSWSEVRNWLAEADDQLLRDCFRSFTAEEAEQLWLRINRMRAFEDFRKDEILKAVQAAHVAVGVVAPKPEDSIYNTREGIERKEAELKQLVDVEIPKSTDDVGRAREFGDLSENYEYKAAKEKQARLFGRVAQIQRDLSVVRPIDFSKTDTSIVSIGTIVKVEETPVADTQEFTILGPWDIDPDKGIISYQAPFAQRLMGKRVGDFVPQNPNMPGTKGHKIIEIRRAF
jgi:transcription elongation GreA/GreB family factor